MNKTTYILFITLLLYSCNSEDSVNTGNLESNNLTSTTITIEQELEDGNTILRPVIIQAPNVIDINKNYPVVFAYHGRGGNNNSWINILGNYTNSGAFIGVYPQGYLESWNLGPEPSNADDVEFTNLIIAELESYNNLNLEKIYAIGVSNGSGLSLIHI